MALASAVSMESSVSSDSRQNARRQRTEQNPRLTNICDARWGGFCTQTALSPGAIRTPHRHTRGSGLGDSRTRTPSR
jgi:hypothetical protein